MARKSKKAAGKGKRSEVNKIQRIELSLKEYDIISKKKLNFSAVDSETHKSEDKEENELSEAENGGNIGTEDALHHTNESYGNIDSNKLRTSLFELKKMNIRRYATKLKAYHTSTNFFSAIVNAEMTNTSNVIDVPLIWQFKNPSKRYLNNPKFYVNKPKFELPRLIEMTGVSEMRDSSKEKAEEEKIEDLKKISQYRTSGTILNGVSLDYEKNYHLLIKLGANGYDRSRLLPFGKVFKESMDLTNLNSENDTKNMLFANDIRVGKLSKNLLSALGMDGKGKTVFPYWCKIAHFNNRAGEIVLNEGKGVVDSATGEYCELKNKRAGSLPQGGVLFGSKLV